MVVDMTMVLGVVAWCKGASMRQQSSGVHSGAVPQGMWQASLLLLLAAVSKRNRRAQVTRQGWTKGHGNKLT